MFRRLDRMSKNLGFLNFELNFYFHNEQNEYSCWEWLLYSVLTSNTFVQSIFKIVRAPAPQQILYAALTQARNLTVLKLYKRVAAREPYD